MSQKTTIGWTRRTWNPTHGCSAAGEGCRNCYAEKQSLRWGHTDEPWTYPNAAVNVHVKPHKLKDPAGIREPSRIFVNSMSDLFHEQITDLYRARVWAEMAAADHHVFQVLTKHGADREWNRSAMTGWTYWPDNVWMGVSVPNRRAKRRIPALRDTDATVKFLSCEPLLEPLGTVDLSGIDWVIAGGESGAMGERRPASHAWGRELRNQCERAGVPFYWKQSSGRWNERGTALMESGGYWTEPTGSVEFLPDGELTVYRELPPLPDPLLDAHPRLEKWTPGGECYGGVTVDLSPDDHHRVTNHGRLDTVSREGVPVTVADAGELDDGAGDPGRVVVADG